MYSVVYITCSNNEEAKKIAASLLGDKLIACANIHSMNSLFHWEGQIEDESECVLWCKTKSEKIPEIEKLVNEIHSYEIPCIVNFPFQANSKYLRWIDQELEDS